MNYRINYKSCPLCDSASFYPIYRGDCSKHKLYKPELPTLMQWMECTECKHHFIDGYFNDDGIKKIFSDTHENQKIGYQIEQQRLVSARILNKVIAYKDSGTWLDIGFGDGALLFTAQEYGFNCIGTDLREENVKIIKNLGIEAYSENIENIKFNEKISVVSMMDVLEHVPYPKKMLSVVSNILEENGIIVISMPNIESMIWKLMKQNNKNPYLGEIEHYHNFSRTRLYKLLIEFSLKPIHYGISERYRACMEVIAIKN